MSTTALGSTGHIIDGPQTYMGNFVVQPVFELQENYHFIKTLGEGSYGAVWLCELRQTRRQYACKVIRRDARTLAATKREVDTMSRVLGCSSIVNLEGVYEDADWLYLLLELADSGDLLSEINRAGGLPEASAKLLFRQLVQAVAHCHSSGVVHRDLKPENVFLSKRVESSGKSDADVAQVKLGDFGLAVYLSPDQTLSSHAGSYPYEAPEVMAQQQSDTSADIWSLGVVLYAMLSAMWPTFKDNRRRLDESVDWTPDCWLTISPLAKNLIRRLLTVTPSKRPTAAQILRDPWFQSEKLQQQCCQTKPTLPKPAILQAVLPEPQIFTLGLPDLKLDQRASFRGPEIERHDQEASLRYWLADVIPLDETKQTPGRVVCSKREAENASPDAGVRWKKETALKVHSDSSSWCAGGGAGRGAGAGEQMSRVVAFGSDIVVLVR